MANKMKGLPSSAFEVRELKTEVKPEVVSDEMAVSPIDQLELCRRKVNNYRQGPGIDTIIDLCESEPLPVKMNKVIVNINAMLSFARLDDEKLSAFMRRNIEDIYNDAFDYFDIDEDTKMELYEGRKDTHQTTVEVNTFMNRIINQSIDRVNNLPPVVALRDEMYERGLLRERGPLYNATDIRERALFYFAALPGNSKIKIINDIASEYGMFLTRLTDRQFEKKTKNLKL